MILLVFIPIRLVLVTVEFRSTYSPTHNDHKSSADDLVIIADYIEELVNRTSAWKAGLKSKGQRVNVRKTKVLYSSKDKNVHVDKEKWLCGLCRKGVGSNSVFCHGCSCR